MLESGVKIEGNEVIPPAPDYIVKARKIVFFLSNFCTNFLPRLLISKKVYLGFFKLTIIFIFK
tara:strand:- start:89 stop:277 length:189 start_codon:yes stop_codon:yes gene_type:complete